MNQPEEVNQMNIINCSYCHQDKESDMFYKGHKTCKDCVKQKNKKRYEENRTSYLAKRREKNVKNKKDVEIAIDQKLCNGCNEYYLIDEFDKGKKKCKTCRSLYNKKIYATRKEKKQKEVQEQEVNPVNNQLTELIRSMFVTALSDHIRKSVDNALLF